MAANVLQINVTLYNGLTLTTPFTAVLSNPSANDGFQQQFAFGTGDNTLTKPTGCNWLILNNISGTLKLYASTNPSLGTTSPAVIPVAQTTVVINASAGAKSDILWG